MNCEQLYIWGIKPKWYVMDLILKLNLCMAINVFSILKLLSEMTAECSAVLLSRINISVEKLRREILLFMNNTDLKKKSDSTLIQQ